MSSLIWSAIVLAISAAGLVWTVLAWARLARWRRRNKRLHRFLD